jgi:predicted metal-dependent enzyme (double-stranded beta helix superfamily)
MVARSVVAEAKCTEASVPLREFIAGVRKIVRAGNNRKRVAGAVAELLDAYLQVEDLLKRDQMQPNAEKYRQHVLHVETDGSFSIAALVWLPGQETPIHDHVSWCVDRLLSRARRVF